MESEFVGQSQDGVPPRNTLRYCALLADLSFAEPYQMRTRSPGAR